MIECIGSAVYDMTAYLEGALRPGQKYRADESMGCPGGPALNAASVCGLWGADVALVARVGTDAHGDAVVASLRRCGVDASWCLREDAPTSWSVIMVDPAGERTIVNFPGAVLEDPLPLPDVEPRVILSDGHEVATSLAALRAHPQALSVIDAGTCREGTLAVARECGYVVSSRAFARQYLGHELQLGDLAAVEDDLRRMQEINHGVVVVTLGDQGCVWLDEAGEFGRLPAVPVQAVDTCGAGDIFHGAFAYAIDKGLSLAESLRLASAAAAVSVTRRGGQPSIPTLAEVEAVCAAIRG